MSLKYKVGDVVFVPFIVTEIDEASDVLPYRARHLREETELAEMWIGRGFLEFELGDLKLEHILGALINLGFKLNVEAENR